MHFSLLWDSRSHVSSLFLSPQRSAGSYPDLKSALLSNVSTLFLVYFLSAGPSTLLGSVTPLPPSSLAPLLWPRPWPCPPWVIYHGPGGEPPGLRAPVSSCNRLFVAPSKQVLDQQKSIKAWWAFLSQLGSGHWAALLATLRALCRHRSLTHIPPRLMIFSSHLGLTRRVLLTFSLPSLHSVLSFFLSNPFLLVFFTPLLLPFTANPINVHHLCVGCVRSLSTYEWLRLMVAYYFIVNAF